VALGPAILAKIVGPKAVDDGAGRRRYRLRPPEAMAAMLRLAYGHVPDRVVERWCRGLTRVVELLASGEDARASIHAVLLGFPEIPHEGMAKLSRAANLRKYGDAWEDEPRVPAGNPDGGQWTTGDDVEVAAAGDLPCDGFYGGCQSGGSYGSTAMFGIENKNLCYDCAVKMTGTQNQPASERMKTLKFYLLKKNN